MTAIIAHRGASRAERENTVAAFRRAVEMGADGVELDVRRTRDDVLVVHHDAYFLASNGDKTLLRSVQSCVLPTHIPTLHEALIAATGAFVNVEIKNSPEEPDFDSARSMVAVVVEELGNWDTANWVISSFDRVVIDRVRELAPHLVTALLNVETKISDLDDVRAAGHGGIHPWVASLTQEIVREAHSRGLFVNAWTCNEVERIQELAAWGVDGIVTDVPDLARRALAGPEAM
jgi:glycerophosphoryl diester phosphodiesterase